jgi:hypothetical protein
MEKIVKEVARQLIDCYQKKTVLRFPDYREKNSTRTIRVSEQESRVFFTKELFDRKIPFAVEVPTNMVHSFSGNAGRSASHDLAVYKPGGTELEWVIEFKAKNPEPEQIRKDFEKMMKSGNNCIWLHTLERRNSGTLPSLLGKFKRAFEQEHCKHEGTSAWIIAIVVLDSKELFTTTVQISDGTADRPFFAETDYECV